MLDKHKSSIFVPKPLRILACWSEQEVWYLKKALRNLIKFSQLSLDDCTLSELEKQLGRTDYFHVLVISVKDFCSCNLEQRMNIANKVNLICVMPGYFQQMPEDILVLPTSALIFQDYIDDGQVTSFLISFLEALINQNGVVESATMSREGMHPINIHPILHLTRPDGLIWPAQLINIDPSKQLSLQNNAERGITTELSGLQTVVYIGKAEKVINTQQYKEIRGDSVEIVKGDQDLQNIHNEVNGDQVNINRFTQPLASLSQTANGDQININRISSSDGSVEQMPQCTQELVNQNGSSSLPIRCSYCNSVVNENDHYCEMCGKPI